MSQQKKIWVSFLVIASVLVLASVVSASALDISYNTVKVNNIATSAGIGGVSIDSGSTIPVEVTFTSNTNASDVRLRATLEGTKTDVDQELFVGDIEAGQTYQKSFTINVPSDLQDIQSDNTNLVIRIWNGDFSENTYSTQLRVQRQPYDVQIMSLSTVDNIVAGQLVPVDVVLKNTGYNQLNDLYVTLSIPALNLQRSAYFGDLVAIENKDNPDTASGRIFLQIPYTAQAGTYDLKLEVKNGDFDEKSTKSISISNDFASNVITSTSSLRAGVGQDVTYNIEIVNPTNEIKVYNIVPDSVLGVTMSGSTMVTVPAGLSRTVPLTAHANSAGDYNLSVNVFSGQDLTGKVSLGLTADGGVSNPVVVLTIVMAIMFVALLVVLVVLVTKKPNKKQEGFEESYY